MDDDSTRETVPHYRAFISYSHADSRFAAWLHGRLERSRDADGARLTPIFIDRAELVAGPDLPAQVRDALARSAALIVIASPTARASRWVGQEIALFRQLHPDRPILAALTEGEPDEAFPEALVRDGDRALEPLAADFRTGRDGRRLGLLKVVAGLTGQPLDRLVQRDAQARQRRVMAVTAGALVLSLVLAALLVAAIRARNEAERQRAEAEGLVEFMLTDLRDRLKGVGRLDVMDAVNRRVMQRYAGQADLSALPRAELLRRAKLMQAMAEDALSFQGRKEQGRGEAREAYRITAFLIGAHPDDGDVIAAHARSEYWLGYSFFIDDTLPAAARRDQVSAHWKRNRALTARLAAINPDLTEWQLEASYAEGNLCALELSEPARPAAALPHCLRATELLEAVWRKQPNDIETALNLATSYAWQADAKAANGDLPGALALRRQQLDLAEALARRHPADKRADEARFLAGFGLAKQLRAAGREAEARREMAAARAIMADLRHALQETGRAHFTPPRVSMAQSRMAMASASLSSAGAKPFAWTAAMTAALSALPLPVMNRLIVPTGTPW